MTIINLEEIQTATATNPISTTDDNLQINQKTAQLPLGEHRFELTVVDNSGNASEPVTLSVFIIDTEKPTAILTLLDANRKPVLGNKIPHGSSFILSGQSSSDAGGGAIVKYIWKMV